MSKHLVGWRDHASMAMESIRGEGWKVRRIAVDVWKVSDRRPYRWERQRRPRQSMILNRAGLLWFAGIRDDLPLGRTFPRPAISVHFPRYVVEDADIPF